jgi:hypothetical protein
MIIRFECPADFAYNRPIYASLSDVRAMDERRL